MNKVINILILIISYLSLIINAQQFDQSGRCTTPLRQPGVCQPLQSCQSLLQLIRKPLLSTDERNFINQSQCGYMSLVCCPGGGNTNFNNGNNGPPSTTTLLPNPGECGIQAQNKIFGGEETIIGEYPWMALLEYSKPNSARDFHCGGNLISNRYVLTASHCINGPSVPRAWKVVSVRLGEWDMAIDPDCEVNERNEQYCADSAMDISIAQIITHENYNARATNQANDIALLRLKRAVQYSDFIQPICLPRSPALENIDYNGITMVVAGWGRTETENQPAKQLQLKLEGVSFDRCSSIYRNLNAVLQDSQICAGGKKGFDSCTGDSGGPLMTIDVSTPKHYWYLAGIVSFGPKRCGTEGVPGVYTKASSYISWIESKLQP